MLIVIIIVATNLVKFNIICLYFKIKLDPACPNIEQLFKKVDLL